MHPLPTYDAKYCETRLPHAEGAPLALWKPLLIRPRIVYRSAAAASASNAEHAPTSTQARDLLYIQPTKPAPDELYTQALHYILK